MPTYILSKIERTGSGQKVADLTAVEKPPTELTALSDDDQIPLTDTGSSGAWKYLKPSVLKTWLDSRIAATWAKITGKPSTFPPSVHSHSWDSITSKPSTFPPSAHNQAASTITGLGALATRNSVGQSQIDADSVGSSEVKNSDAAGIRTAIGLGTAATKDAADPLEAVNSTPVDVNNGNSLTGRRWYGTGVTIPTSGQVLSLSAKYGTSSPRSRYFGTFLRSDLIALTERSISGSTSGNDVIEVAGGQSVGIFITRGGSNEILIAADTSSTNREIVGLTFYKSRQAVD